MNPFIWISIGAGGAIGAMARHGVSQIAFRLLGPHFPWGTLAVNVVGSVAMGMLIVWLARHEPQHVALRAFLTVGLLGAFTTFSAFSLDTVTLYKDRSLSIAAIYLTASVVLSVGGLVGGMLAARATS